MTVEKPTKKTWWIFGIPSILWTFVIGIYFLKFHGPLSSNQEVWGQFSDYAAGLINPIISLIGLYAIVIAIRANISAIDETRRQLRSQMFAESESHYVTLEQLFATVPTALKFHGVNSEDLKADGITAQEFGYLMANFTAGGINVRALNETDTSPFPNGDYYRIMLESPDTRKAWKYVQRIMSPSPYKQRIQATIDLIESLEKDVNKPPSQA